MSQAVDYNIVRYLTKLTNLSIILEALKSRGSEYFIYDGLLHVVKGKIALTKTVAKNNGFAKSALVEIGVLILNFEDHNLNTINEQIVSLNEESDSLCIHFEMQADISTGELREIMKNMLDQMFPDGREAAHIALLVVDTPVHMDTPV